MEIKCENCNTIMDYNELEDRIDCICPNCLMAKILPKEELCNK